MRSAWMGILALVAIADDAAAQSADTALTEQQQLGRRLYTQSCLVCHARPHITAGLYGPPLSRESTGGQAEVMRAFITEGSPRMPAFKHQFAPTEIDAIVAFLRTVPKPSGAAAKGGSGDSPVD